MTTNPQPGIGTSTSTSTTDKGGVALRWSAILEPHHDFIVQQLRLRRPQTDIYHDLQMRTVLAIPKNIFYRQLREWGLKSQCQRNVVTDELRYRVAQCADTPFSGYSFTMLLTSLQKDGHEVTVGGLRRLMKEERRRAFKQRFKQVARRPDSPVELVIEPLVEPHGNLSDPNRPWWRPAWYHPSPGGGRADVGNMQEVHWHQWGNRLGECDVPANMDSSGTYKAGGADGFVGWARNREHSQEAHAQEEYIWDRHAQEEHRQQERNQQERTREEQNGGAVERRHERDNTMRDSRTGGLNQSDNGTNGRNQQDNTTYGQVKGT